jgi:hypothetical protein
LPPSIPDRPVSADRRKESLHGPCHKNKTAASDLFEAAVNNLVLFHASKAVLQIQFTFRAAAETAACCRFTFLFIRTINTYTCLKYIYMFAAKGLRIQTASNPY